MPPIEQREARQSVKNAAIIAGINRTSFYKDYIELGKLSKKSDDRGKPYIEFDELCRVFGLETCLDGLQKLQNKQKNENTVKTDLNSHTPTLQKHMEHDSEITVLKVEQARLQGEVNKLSAVLSEKEERIREKESLLNEKNQLLQEQKERLKGLEIRYDRLLEGQKATGSEKGFMSRLKALFS